MGVNNVGGNEGYLGGLSTGARRANLEILRQLKQVKDVKATLFQLYNSSDQLSAEFTNNPTDTVGWDAKTGLKFYADVGIGAINEFSWGRPTFVFEGESGLQLYSSAGSSTLMPYVRQLFVSSTSSAYISMLAAGNKNSSGYPYGSFNVGTNYATLSSGTDGVWTNHASIQVSGANGNMTYSSGGDTSIVWSRNGGTGLMTFPDAVGTKIQLYSGYTIGIEASTLRFDSNDVFRFYRQGALRTEINLSHVTANGNSIYMGAWNVDGSWTGSIFGSCGYLLIGYSGSVANPIYLRTNSGQPVYIGANGQNALTVGQSDITVANSVWCAYQFRSTYSSASTSYTTANAFLGNGGSQATMSLWSSGVAAQFRLGASAQIVYHRIWDDSAYSTFNSIVNNFSSRHAKQNIVSWPTQGASVGAAANALAFPSALEVAKALRPVSYQWKPNVLLAKAPEPRRAEAVERLNKIREGKGLPKWQEENPDEFIHNCERDSDICHYDADGKCIVTRDWEEGQVGFISQEVAEVLPQAAKLDVKSGEYELLDPIALVAVAIGAIQELSARVEELEKQVAKK